MSRPVHRLALALLAGAVAAGLVILGPSGVASAHERVVLSPRHTTPAKGPLLVDGTIARAAFASFDRIGQRRGLRVQFADGQDLRMELLIPDEPVANGLPSGQLPEVLVLAPDGTRTTMRITERTPFFEPYSGTSYLYLARLTAKAQAGIYRVLLTSRSNAPVRAVLGIGYREVSGH